MTRFGLISMLTINFLSKQVITSPTELSISATKVDTTIKLSDGHEVVISSIFKTVFIINGCHCIVALDWSYPLLYIVPNRGDENLQYSQSHKLGHGHSLSKPGMSSGADSSLFMYAPHNIYDPHVEKRTSGVQYQLFQDVSGHRKVNIDEALIVKSSSQPSFRARNADEATNEAASEQGKSNNHAEPEEYGSNTPDPASIMLDHSDNNIPPHVALTHDFIEHLKRVTGQYSEDLGQDDYHLAGAGRMLGRQRDDKSSVSHGKRKHSDIGRQSEPHLEMEKAQSVNISINDNSYDLPSYVWKSSIPNPILSKYPNIDAILGLRVTKRSFVDEVLSNSEAGYSYVSLFLAQKTMRIVIKRDSKAHELNIGASAKSGRLVSVQASYISFGQFRFEFSQFHLNFDTPYIWLPSSVISNLVKETYKQTGIKLSTEYVDGTYRRTLFVPFECNTMILAKFPLLQFHLKDFLISLSGMDYIDYQSLGTRMCIINIGTDTKLKIVHVGYVLLQKYSVTMRSDEQALHTAKHALFITGKASPTVRYFLLKFKDKNEDRRA